MHVFISLVLQKNTTNTSEDRASAAVHPPSPLLLPPPPPSSSLLSPPPSPLLLRLPGLVLPTLMDLTRLAVVLATSLADWTNCRLATGLGVLEEARRHALQSADVCLATMVAAESTWGRGSEVKEVKYRLTKRRSDVTGRRVPGTGCRPGPPGSGRPSGWTGWPGRTGRGPPGPSGPPSCWGPRPPPGRRPGGDNRVTLQ